MNERACPGQTLDCALCIVGAGWAALNGLNAAAKYLKRGERVVLVDRNQTWGGQWIHQYDFLRLHQPYRMFTAGDQRWRLRRDPSYLATRREVLEHLSSVPAVSAGHLEVIPLFGHTYRGHRVREGRAEVDATPVSDGEAARGPVRIRARLLLKATGLDIEPLPPFQLSSTRVRSVAVSDRVLATPEFQESRAPVYVIGSGKTAMDTVRHLVSRSWPRRRSVNVLTGSGMWFFSRDALYPSGRRRFTQGTLTGDLFLRITQLFDGSNELSVMRALEREGLAMRVFDQGGNCRHGLLSSAERAEIIAGVDQIYRGHLVDVEGTQMALREGQQQRKVSVPEGSWFINCTTHFRQLPHEPVLQDSGVVCAPQLGMGVTGTTAYYITHLWYCNELAAVAPELFRIRIDVEPKLRFAPQLAMMAVANMVLAFTRLPLSVLSRAEGDFHKWYPLPRQIQTVARVLAKRREILRKAERVLKLRFSDSPDVA